MRVAVHGHSELMAVYHTAHNKAVGARVLWRKSSDLIPLTVGARAGTTPIRRAVAEHRPPLSSPGRLALDRLGAAHLEVLLLIGVVNEGRYTKSRANGRHIVWRVYRQNHKAFA